MIAIHPRHNELYKYLSFAPIGAMQTYSDGKSAVPMIQIVRQFNEDIRDKNLGSYKKVQLKEMKSRNEQFTWNIELVREFLIEKKDLWSKIPPASQAYLLSRYPGLVP